MKLIDKIVAKYAGQELLKIKDIKIKPSFKSVNPQKMEIKREYVKKYGMYKEHIIVNKHNYLIDGYTTYLLAIEDGLDEIIGLRHEI